MIKSHKIESVNALTFCWPYLCYSFKSNNLMIYNIFDREHIHNVVISEEQKHQEILAMYITETNDLFIVTKYKRSYLVQMIDLDKSNIMEFKGDRFDFKD